MASSLFNLRAWQSSRTTSFQVFFGLPLGLGPSTSCSIHFFTQSSSSFRNTWPYHYHPLLTYNTDCNDAGCQTTKSPVRSVQELNTDANLTAAISDCFTAPRQICSIWHLLSRHTKLYQQCMHLFVRWATATPSWLEYSNTSWQQTWTDRHDWDPRQTWLGSTDSLMLRVATRPRFPGMSRICVMWFRISAGPAPGCEMSLISRHARY